MNMAAAHLNIVEGSEFIVDSDGYAANHQHGGKESYRGEKQPLPARFSKSCIVNVAEAGIPDKSDQSGQNATDDQGANIISSELEILYKRLDVEYQAFLVATGQGTPAELLKAAA